MTTQVFKTNGQLLTSIVDYTINSTSCSVILSGRGTMNFGEKIQDGLVSVIENFCNSNAPSYPLEGQIWYQNFNINSDGSGTDTKKLKFYSNDTTLGTSGWIQVTDQRDIANIQVEIDSINSHLSTIDSEIAAINSHLSTIDGEIANIEGEISNINGEIAEINSHLNLLDTEISTINSHLTLLDGEIATINNTLAGINTHLNTIDGEITDLQKQLNSQGTSQSLYVLRHNNSPDTNIYSGDLGSNSSKYTNIYASIFNGTATSARFADLAELYKSDKFYPIGILVKIGGINEITIVNEEHDVYVFGVISENPGFLLNSEYTNNKEYLPVALQGKVKVLIRGPITKGDFVVSTTEGYGKSFRPVNRNFNPIIIIGRALETNVSNDIKEVMCFIGK